MTIKDDQEKQTLLRPYVPQSNSAALTHNWNTLSSFEEPTPLKQSETHRYEALVSKDQLAVLDAKAVVPQTQSTYVTQADAVVENTSDMLRAELETEEGFIENILSRYPSYAYKFRLFMTNEIDIALRAKTGTEANLYNALDELNQYTLAESGVTAGFNIKSVEMNTAAGPNFRTRNSYLTEIKMEVNEPKGSSFTEVLSNAAERLRISNYRLFWYYLELTFISYNDDGSINESPLEDLNLPNGGRWIWQIDINKLDARVDESGSNYTLSCRPHSMTAFNDNFLGTPDNLTVEGSTIGDLFADMSKKLTQAYTRRYAGEIYKFKIVNRGIEGKDIDMNTFKVQPDKDVDNIRALSMVANKKNIPSASIPKGTTVSDFIDFAFIHSEDAQKIMLDTSSPVNLEDSDGTFNGKGYRASVIFRIETDVVVTGFDPITNTYMKEITYNVWGYKTKAALLSRSQGDNIIKSPKVAVDMVKAIKADGGMKKKYDFMYTGMNTEVLRFDFNYNMAFSVVLGNIAGWRQGYDQVAVHAKVAPNGTNIKAGGSQSGEVNELTVDQVAKQIDDLKRDRATAEANSQLTDAQRQTVFAQIDARSRRLQTRADLLRKNYNDAKVSQLEADIRDGSTNAYSEDTFGEDYVPTYDSTLKISYQSQTDESTNAQGTGFLGHWHRGESLTGSLFNQLYQPMNNAMFKISIDIRGDPYWLGASNLDRRALLNGLTLKQSQHADLKALPTFVQHDTAFALNFRFPARIDPETQIPEIRKDDSFNGVYVVTMIKSVFSDGAFTQTLDAYKLPLVNMVGQSNPKTTDAGTIQ
jgi:hypothetical protein